MGHETSGYWTEMNQDAFGRDVPSFDAIRINESTSSRRGRRRSYNREFKKSDRDRSLRERSRSPRQRKRRDHQRNVSSDDASTSSERSVRRRLRSGDDHDRGKNERLQPRLRGSLEEDTKYRRHFHDERHQRPRSRSPQSGRSEHRPQEQVASQQNERQAKPEEPGRRNEASEMEAKPDVESSTTKLDRSLERSPRKSKHKKKHSHKHRRRRQSDSESNSGWSSSSSSSSSPASSAKRHKHKKRSKEKKQKSKKEKKPRDERTKKSRNDEMGDATAPQSGQDIDSASVISKTSMGKDPTGVPAIQQPQRLASSTTGSALPPVMPPSILGSGTLTTNKTIIKGYATKFKSEIQARDGILVRKGKPDEEFRVVRFVLGDFSLSISNPFTSELSTPTPFHVVHNPHRASSGIGTALITQTNPAILNAVEASSSAPSLTREELLDLRAKNKTDRRC